MESFPEIIRTPHLAEQVVIVTGQGGCGKSLLSAIVATLKRVEKLTIAYEMEYVCALKYLKRMGDDTAVAMIRMFTDLRLYDLMMCRETNFRPSDVSSVFRDAYPMRYLRRMFQKGNEVIPERIRREKPILHLCMHNITGFSEPIFSALGNRVVMIEFVRHPLYMIKQMAFNMETLLGDVRDFTIHYRYKDMELPYYVLGWEELFLSSNDVEKAIYTIESIRKGCDKLKRGILEEKVKSAQIITIPFECFVIDPWPYIEKIEQVLKTERTPATQRMMNHHKVPRKMYADGVGLSIYKRYGWEPPKPGLDENKEFALRMAFAEKRASKEAIEVLRQISTEYEERYLGGKKGYIH